MGPLDDAKAIPKTESSLQQSSYSCCPVLGFAQRTSDFCANGTICAKRVQRHAMNGRFRAFATFSLLVLTVAPVRGEGNRLVGLWECYRQSDRAEITSCLYSIEFFQDGSVIQKHMSEAEVELRGTYSVNANHINVKFEDGERCRYGFKFLKNGDLYLSKTPWDWKGWLTRDSTRVPKNHGCGWLGVGDKE